MNARAFFLSGLLVLGGAAQAYELPVELVAEDYAAALGVQGERIDVSEDLYAYDPATLTLQGSGTVTVFFISEGAGYHNSFGFYDASRDPNADDRTLIWEDASGTGAGLAGGGSLEFGDSHVIGHFDAGTELGFYLIQNGANNADNTRFYSNPDLNPDGLQHLVTMTPVAGFANLMALGWEDLTNGGDRDYNDLLVAIGIDYDNAAAVNSPSALFLLGSVLVPLAAFRRRVAPLQAD